MVRELAETLALCMVGIGALFDYRYKAIPTILPGVGIITAFVLQYVLGSSFIDIGLGMIPGLILLMIAFLSGQKIGYGDGLMICAAGGFIGVEMCMIVMIIALFLSCVVLLAGFILRRVRLSDQIPFLPFLLLGYVCGMGVFV